MNNKHSRKRRSREKTSFRVVFKRISKNLLREMLINNFWWINYTFCSVLCVFFVEWKELELKENYNTIKKKVQQASPCVNSWNKWFLRWAPLAGYVIVVVMKSFLTFYQHFTKSGSGKECNIVSLGPSVPLRPIFVDKERSRHEISFLLRNLKKKIQKSLTFSFSSEDFFPETIS